MSKPEFKSDLLKLAAPAQRALAAAGVERLEQLTGFTEAEVTAWHGIGPNALLQLHQALSAPGAYPSLLQLQNRSSPPDNFRLDLIQG